MWFFPVSGNRKADKPKLSYKKSIFYTRFVSVFRFAYHDVTLTSQNVITQGPRHDFVLAGSKPVYARPSAWPSSFELSYREVVGVHCLRLCLPEHRWTKDRNKTQTKPFYRSCWRKKRIDTVPIAEQKVRNVVRSTANVIFRSHWISMSTLLSCKIYFLIGNYTYVFVF